MKLRRTNCLLCGKKLYTHNTSEVRVDACRFCYPNYGEFKKNVKLVKKNVGLKGVRCF